MDAATYEWFEEARVLVPPALLRIRAELAAGTRELEKRLPDRASWRSR